MSVLFIWEEDKNYWRIRHANTTVDKPQGAADIEDAYGESPPPPALVKGPLWLKVEAS